MDFHLCIRFGMSDKIRLTQSLVKICLHVYDFILE